MNKIYKVVYCKATQTMVAVSEFAKSRGKSSSRSTGALTASRFNLSKLSLALLAAFSMQSANALVVFPGSGSTDTGTESLSAGFGTTTSARAATAIGQGTTASAIYATAMGLNTLASGEQSVAMGNTTHAQGDGSTAMGFKTHAEGTSSLATGSLTHAEGANSTAMGNTTHAEGEGSVAMGFTTHAEGVSSLATGSLTHSKGANSTAMGNTTYAEGEGSVAMGFKTHTKGTSSLATGSLTYAEGANSTAMGNTTHAKGEGSVAMGFKTYAEGVSSLAAGSSTHAKGENSMAMGSTTYAEGDNSMAVGDTTHAEGENSMAVGYSTHAEGKSSMAMGSGTHAAGEGSMAVGTGAQALGYAAMAMGDQSVASSYGAVAMGGFKSRAVGASSLAAVGGAAYTTNSMALGTGTVAGVENEGQEAVAIGYRSKATGNKSLALGFDNAVASGHGSIAAGVNAKSTKKATISIGWSAKAEKDKAIAIGEDARAIGGIEDIAIGKGTLASGGQSIALGNDIHATGERAIVIGTRSFNGDNTLTDIPPGDATSGNMAIAIGSGRGKGDNNAPEYIDDNGNPDNIAIVKGDYGIALGTSSKIEVDAKEGIAIGRSANVSEAKGIAIGSGATASGEKSISVGVGNTVSGTNSGAFGDPSTVSGNASYSFGNDNTVSNDNTFVVGSNVTTTQDNAVVLGNDSADKAHAQINDANVNGMAYSGFAGTATGIVSVGAADKERQIVNVAPGKISEDSTDAINGSQLYAVASQIVPGGGDTYFHFNDPFMTQADGDAITNKGGITDKAGATGAFSTTAGVGAQATKQGGIAIGHNAKSEGSYAVVLSGNGKNSATGAYAVSMGLGTTAKGDYSTAMGKNTTASGAFSTATGASTIASGTHSTAMGYGSKATESSSFAAGNGAIASGVYSVAIGSGGKASGTHAVALGLNTKSEGVASTAMGSSTTASGQAATAMGSGSKATGNFSTAMGGAVHAKGNYSTAMGNHTKANGDFSTAMGNYSKAEGKYATAMGSGSTAAGEDSLATQGGKAWTENSIAIGQGTVAGADGGSQEAVAMGYRAKATANKSLALGFDAKAEHANSVALGEQAETKDFAQVNSGTVSGVTYGSFAGTANGVVSVGKAGAEKQIVNVAPGEISETSTDAINGSQLHLIATGLADNSPFEYADKDGNKLMRVGDKYYAPDQFDADGNLIVGAVETPEGDVVIQARDGEKTVTGIASTLPGTKDNDLAAPDGDSSVVAPTLTDAQKTNSATIDDVLNAGWNLQGNDAAVDFVKPYDTVNFIDGENTKVVVKTDDNKTSTVQVNVDGQGLIESVQLPVVYTDKDGNKLYKQDDGTFNTAADGTGTQVQPADVIASMQNGAGETTTPMALSNVASTLPGTKGNDLVAPDSASVVAAPILTDAQKSNAATVDDVLNSGWNLQGNGNDVDFVKAYDTVNFVDGGGTKAVVTVDADNEVSEVTYNVNADNKTIVVQGTDGNGDTVYQQPDGTFNTKVDGTGTSAVGDVTDTQVAANTGDLNVNDGSDPANTDPVGEVVAPDPDALATAGDIANAINNSGFLVTSSADGGVANGSSEELVTPGDKLEFVAGEHITIDQAGSKFTFKTNNQAIANDAQLPVVYTKEDGTKVYKQADGTFNTAKDGAGDAVAPADIIASMQGAGGSTTEPTTLANVAGNLDGAKAGTTAPTDAATRPDDLVESNAATVGDVLNAGWNLQGDGEAKDFVKAYDTVNFVDGAGTDAVVESDGMTSTVKYDVKTDGKTIGIDADGNVAAITGDITANPDGTTTAADPDALATAGDISNAINNSGFLVTSSADGGTVSGTQEDKLVTPGDKLEFVAGAHMNIKQEGSKFTFETNNQAIANDAQLPVVYTKADGTKVYKQPDGTFNTVADGSGDTVAPADIIASMQGADNSTTNPSTLANVKSNIGNNDSDGAAITPAVAKANVTNLLGNTDGLNKAATTGDLQAIAQAGLDFAGDDGTVIHKPLGSQLDIVGGAKGELSDDNIGINASADGKLEVKLARDLKGLNSVETIDADGNKTVQNGGGITITPADTNKKPVSITSNGLDNGGNRITNVAPGIDNTDAVNLGQLKNTAGKLYNAIGEVSKDSKAGIAGAYAAAALGQPHDPGASTIGAAIGTFRNQHALAIGVSSISDNGRWILKGLVGHDTQNHTGAAASVNYQW